MKIITIKNPPHTIEYHEDWSPIIKTITTNYDNVYEHIKDKMNPPEDKVFNFLKSSIKDKLICFLGFEPYTEDATGILFQSLDFNKSSITNIAEKIKEENKISGSYKNCDLSLIDEILCLNLIPTVKYGNYRSHEIFWKETSVEMVNFLVNKIDFFVVFGKDLNFISRKSNQENFSIINCVCPNEYLFKKKEYHLFSLINEVLKLKNYDIINWGRALIK